MAILELTVCRPGDPSRASSLEKPNRIQWTDRAVGVPSRRPESTAWRRWV